MRITRKKYVSQTSKKPVQGDPRLQALTNSYASPLEQRFEEPYPNRKITNMYVIDGPSQGMIEREIKMQSILKHTTITRSPQKSPVYQPSPE